MTPSTIYGGIDSILIGNGSAMKLKYIGALVFHFFDRPLPVMHFMFQP